MPEDRSLQNLWIKSEEVEKKLADLKGAGGSHVADVCYRVPCRHFSGLIKKMCDMVFPANKSHRTNRIPPNQWTAGEKGITARNVLKWKILHCDK